MQEHPFPVIDPEATGRNILHLRREKGLSVRELQVFFHFDEPRAIYKWQSGQSLPTVDNLFALSRLLGVRMEDILVCRNGTGPRKDLRDPAPLFGGFLWKNAPLRETELENIF